MKIKSHHIIGGVVVCILMDKVLSFKRTKAVDKQLTLLEMQLNTLEYKLDTEIELLEKRKKENLGKIAKSLGFNENFLNDLKA